MARNKAAAKINFGPTRSFSRLSLDITQGEGKKRKPDFAIDGFINRMNIKFIIWSIYADYVLKVQVRYVQNCSTSEPLKILSDHCGDNHLLARHLTTFLSILNANKPF